MGKGRGKGKRRGNGKSRAAIGFVKYEKNGEGSSEVDKSPRAEKIDEMSKKVVEVGEEFEEVSEVVGTGKRRGSSKPRADLGKHDKIGEASTEAVKPLKIEQIDDLSKIEDEEVGEEFEEVFEVVGYEEMCGEEYVEEIIEVDADEEIIEEIEEIIEVELEEPEVEEVGDVREEPCEVEEKREDIVKKTDEEEEPSEDEVVEEWQSEDVEGEPDNKEEQCKDEKEEADNEEVEEEMEDVEEETNEETEPSEDEQVEEVATEDQGVCLNKQEDCDGLGTERPTCKVPYELKENKELSENVGKSSDSYNTKQESSHDILSFSGNKEVGVNISQIRLDSSKGEPCYGSPVIALNTGTAEMVSGYSSQEQGANISSSKKKHSRWDSQSECLPNTCEVGDEMANKKRKSRWSCENPVKMPEILEIPHFFSDNNKTMQDPKIQQLVEELKNINQAFLKATGAKDSSNKALAIQNSIMQASLRAQFVKQKQKIFSLLLKKGFDFKSLLDGKCSKIEKYVKKIYVPVKEYPDYDFVGLFLGPRGNNHKRMELESGAKIKLRGKGSSREDRAVKATQDPSKDEDLHVIIEADSEESFNSAVKMVEKLLIPVAETENELKRAQLRELAALKGKIAPDDLCELCGDAGHPSGRCPLIAGTPGANGHSAKGCDEVGAGLSSTSKIDGVNVFSGGQLLNKKVDDRKLFVGQLPYAVDDSRLVELFCQYGELLEARIVKDADTGVSQGYAFVKYRHPADAAKAVKHMHGFRFEGRTLKVEISGLSTKSPTTDPQKTAGYQQAPQGSLVVPQPSPIPTYRPVTSSFPGSSDPVQPYVSRLPINVSVLRLGQPSYLASAVPSPANTYSSSADLEQFAGNPDKLPSPFNFQLGKPSSSLFSSGAASAPKQQPAFGNHVYPSHTATTGSASLVRPPLSAHTISPLGRPPLSAHTISPLGRPPLAAPSIGRPSFATPSAGSFNFPGNPDSFRSRFL